MIAVAKTNSSNFEIDYHEDSVTSLKTIEDDSVDFIVSNYVIQVKNSHLPHTAGFPRLRRYLQGFFSRFKNGWPIIKIFTWPGKDSGQSYFDCTLDFNFLMFVGYRVSEEPWWGKFETPFIAYHRPLSSYWKAIVEAGLAIKKFEEPGKSLYDCPCAVLFLLEKC
jgi:hypothetical protein